MSSGDTLCLRCGSNPRMRYGLICEWCWRRRVEETGLPWVSRVHVPTTVVVVALVAILVGLNLWVYLW